MTMNKIEMLQVKLIMINFFFLIICLKSNVMMCVTKIMTMMTMTMINWFDH